MGNIDIVICVSLYHAKYIKVLVNNIKEYIININKIYLIMPTNILEKYRIYDPIVENVDENIFPFNKEYIDNLFKCPERSGWYLQQLIKLYAGFVIEELLDDYLIIDADVFFLKPIYFYEDTKYMFTSSDENHEPYFRHMLKLHPSFTKQIKKSGISHHMIFNKKIIKEMFNLVEDFHKKEFWVIFIEMVDEHTKQPINDYESGAYEYELYFNYMIQYHRDKILVRNLLWDNKKSNYNISTPCNLDYISICSWAK